MIDYGCGKSYFSMSKQPMHTENDLLHNSPFDNIDYQTPTFIAKLRPIKPIAKNYAS